ncbi:hypothetical protein PR202_ga15952 [Eleusine coracana subsp. coracana]|uniref:F-box domain-containing protein n=1 Tax=Eleusine coracana subsp. coracana TaxID=191504 RepID=A0AAV5CL75_ELECO|nr:hypothetical protein PR202_ga15952 [Eleusine coracana subsp. coracana]
MSPPVQERGWSSLPADLLRDILSRLPWSSHPSFAATCKHWSTIVSLFYPAWITPVLLNAVDVGSTRIRYYSPYYHKIFEEDGDWSRYWEFSELIHPEPKVKASPMTNPVLHHGLLYMLRKDGRLAVYDDRQHDEGFKILDKPTDPGFKYDDYYLFESDEGDLMAVLVDRRGSPLYVVKLNEDVMEWEKVESLEGRALFTGTLTTMMVKTDVKWIQNKIIFPRLHHWPDVVHCDLVDREGEVAFVPKSTMVSQDGAVQDKSI